MRRSRALGLSRWLLLIFVLLRKAFCTQESAQPASGIAVAVEGAQIAATPALDHQASLDAHAVRTWPGRRFLRRILAGAIQKNRS